MVFGDGVNDVCLFREFCHSRAVANAVPQIINMAEKVVADCEENGVAREVAEMFSISLQEVLKVQKEENKNAMENRRWYILLKKEKYILPRQLHDYLRLNVKR